MDLTQMQPLSLSSSVLLCQARVAATAGWLLAHGADAPSQLRAPLLETSTALPDAGWEPGRRQSLGLTQLVVKDVKQAALFTFCPEWTTHPLTFTFPCSATVRAIVFFIIIFLPVVRRHDFIVVIFNLLAPGC